MRRRRQGLMILFIFSTSVLVYLSLPIFFKANKNGILTLYNPTAAEKQETNNESKPVPALTIAVVACGQRLKDTLIMIKSALLFRQPNEYLHFIIFAEDSLMLEFNEKLADWKELVPPRAFEFEIRPLQFPKLLEKEWRHLFKPCASQRLFLPSLLPSIDSLLYVDTDIIFVSPVSDTWQFFNKFNATQIAALSPEHENENAGWYNRFARHPFYGRLGVNSGVMLMNLTRMRTFDWETQVHAIYAEYKLKLTWGDQDIINVIFYFNPEKLYIMNCSYNYRPDHCIYDSVCNVTNGIKIIHGNRGYFQSRKQPLFRVIYETIERYQLNLDQEPYYEFLLPLREALNEPEVKLSKCGVVAESLIKIASQLFSRREDFYNTGQHIEKDTAEDT